MEFEKIKTLRAVHQDEMSELVKSEVEAYVKEYFKENPSVIEIKIEGDDTYDDQGGSSKVVLATVKLEKTLDIDDSDSDDTTYRQMQALWGHEEMIQEDLHDLADEIYSNVNKTWKRN